MQQKNIGLEHFWTKIMNLDCRMVITFLIYSFSTIICYSGSFIIYNM